MINTKSIGQIIIQNVVSHENISLNGPWNFIIDPYEMGYYDYRLEPFEQSPSKKGGFYDNIINAPKDKRVEYNFSLEPTLQVPGDWNSQYEKLSLYEGTLWYKRDFTVKKEPGKRYFLHFAAVNYESQVYLNGEKLGSHKGGFTPFQFEITDKIINGNNFVVLKVDNKRNKDEIPTINTDWWNYGGITRDVTLIIVPETFISDYKIQLARKSLNQISGFIRLNGNNRKDKIALSIPALNIINEYLTDENGMVNFSFTVKNLKLWSPENPYLYDITITKGNEVIQDKIGFRTIETKDKTILLNGKQLFLKGISMHDENPLIPGRLRSEGDIRMMLSWAKELGCNYVRLAHYTHNEKTIRIADEMGLMVWAEVPVYWTISWENSETYANAVNQLETMIERDKNRASIIIWSIGNETPVSEPRNVFMGKLADLVRAKDDTRLVAAALEVKREGYLIKVDDSLGNKLDLASFNEYGGWYWGITEELPKYTFDIEFNKPVIISEFGGDALGGFHGDSKTIWTEEYQENLYVYQLNMLEKIDGLAGMTPWILVDFRSPRRQNPEFQKFWNRKGLISETGAKKKAFFILQNYYRTK
jgi:beta-glucuronidase